MAGQGARWQVIQALWDRTVERLGFGEHPGPPAGSPFRRPDRDPQLRLI
ncbi:MAG: hypothetical protein ACQEXJ_23890 [Myxococcota bacterium]